MHKIKLTILLILFAGFKCFSQDYLDFFNKGLSQLNNKEYNSAIINFSKAIGVKNESEALYNRAIALYHLGDTKSFCNDMSHAMYCGDDDARELLYKYCYKYDTLISEEKILQIKRTPYFNSTTDTIVYSSERNDTTIYTYYNNTRVYKKTNVKPFYSIVTLNDKKAISQAFGFSEMPDSIYISDTLYLDEDIEVIFSKTIPTVIEITPDNSKSPQIGIQNDNDLQSYIGYMVDYPQEAIDKNVQGNVIVKIVINTKGEISYTEIIHKRDELLNNATLEVIKTIALFEPAYNSKNEAVNYEIIIPITFYLTK